MSIEYRWHQDEGLLEQIELHEGRRNKPYKDTTGHLTVGVGRNLDAVPFSPDEIDLMKANDIARAEAGLDRYASWWRDMDPVRQRVILDMMFNMGWGTLGKFVNTLRSMQEGDYGAAAAGMEQSLWARQVGARAKRLVEMMRTGQLPAVLK